MYVNPMELAPIYIASTTNAVVKALQLEASKPNKTTNSKLEEDNAATSVKKDPIQEDDEKTPRGSSEKRFEEGDEDIHFMNALYINTNALILYDQSKEMSTFLIFYIVNMVSEL
ncbi:hypothetical protein Scep_022906 [Stephania cephalantha]|uniref:Uncharacterized protein n=1 Tax=Stephania cephalantha TaxID=152367 RepID=A0AAP0I198_9MAGN